VIDVDRGGKITWHGPGQLVGYPIARLSESSNAIEHVRRIEIMLLDVCSQFGVMASRVPGRAGVWVPADDHGPARKIAAVGIRVADGVTMHGFAINANPDLSWFDRIVPCGIADADVTSLSKELGRDISVDDVLPAVEARLGSIVLAA
jgi:lipoyl(octanoyl) transferase